MRSAQFSDDESTKEDVGSGEIAEPEYSFEGFDIEFSEKVMLTPLTAAGVARESRTATA